MTIQQKFIEVQRIFQNYMPVAETELHYANPYELLVAVILSAQCTDKRVNMLTPAFYQAFPTAEILSYASFDDVFNFIKSCSYPNNKAKNLIGMAKVLMDEFKGVVPCDVDELQKLPGVGRKTANVIASVVFGQPAMAVDTHVFRVSERIGLTVNAKNPFQAEQQLIKYFPPEIIPIAHHWLILHGRYICKARKPLCNECVLTSVCNFFEKSTI
jgi:endonuclease-3